MRSGNPDRDALRPERAGGAPSRFAAIVTIGITVAMLTGCGSTTANQQESQLRVYATTGYIADAVANIAPNAEVTTMVGPGGDPHSYQPSTRDIERILDADLVLWNGLELEAQMADQLASLGDRQLAVAETLPQELLIPLPETDSDGSPLVDPHVWNDPEAWSQIVLEIANKMSEIHPAGEPGYTERATAFAAEIEREADRISTLLAEIPEPRVLITGHDAFSYFGRTFDLDVRATDFISTEAALGAGELNELAELIVANRVPVIFNDNQANPQAITSLREAVEARGWIVRISAAELYADSLGAEPGVDTYLGSLAHNANTIAETLNEEAR
ncbi:metal ABC transporter substrate-binding protein [Leucobacter sp. W1478]|uniref:metal ABC transporter substrate-binding protein n=1 Tax=Leucobacter sp. W1478 TaxID=3439065 RepID=UPI003F2AE85A